MPTVAVRRAVVVVCSIVIVGWSAAAQAQTVDPTYDPGANQIVSAIAVQPDGKTIVGGSFTGLGGGTGATTRNRIGRLNADGAVEATFNPGANAPVLAVAVQADGKILAGGNFTSVGGGTGLTTSRSHIARFNADGTVDTTFNPGANLNVYALAVQPDGKILVGGNFSALGGGGAGVTPRSGIGRLNADGSLDAAFNPGASKLPSPGAPPEIYAIVVQPDAKILLGGYFNGLGGGTGATPRNFIGRLNADGTVDAAFNPGANSISGVNALALQSDGRILVGGTFTGLGAATGTTPRANIGRLNADGSVDAFNPGAEAQVLTLAVQSNGKILVGGAFKWLGGGGTVGPLQFVRNYIGRLNSDGTVDQTLDPSANKPVGTIRLQSNGGIVIGGTFDRLNSTPNATTGIVRNHLARITNPGAHGTFGDYDGDGKADLAVFRPSSGGWYTLQSSGSTVVATTFGASGDVPVAADYDGDGRADFAVYRPQGGQWFVQQTTAGFMTVQFGLAGDLPVPADFDGDGKTDIAVYRGATGEWYILQSGTGTLQVVALGVSADIPVPGDYDGDGKADIAVYRPGSGTWFILRSTTLTFVNYQFGLTGDVPVPGDYGGDGRTDIAVFRPSTGTWYVLDSASNFTTYSSTAFGLNGDLPQPADYDGDGQTDLAVYRPANGTWYIRQSSSGSIVTMQFGLAGDIPVPGAVIATALAAKGPNKLATLVPYNDFDGDAHADITVYRPATGVWFTLRSSGNYTTVASTQFGVNGDIPVPGDYDGDSKADIAVFRPGSGVWYILRSSDGSFTAQQFGLSGDIPVPGDYDGDGKTDLAVFRPSTGTWYILKSQGSALVSVAWGLSGDSPVAGDYDGDGLSDPAVWRPASGTWFILKSSGNFSTSLQFQWGLNGDIAVPGDFDGDGKTDLGLFRPANGTWYVNQNPTNAPTALIKQFGLNGDIPVAGDYDGDGKVDLAVFRPASGTWYLLQSGANFTTSASYQFGLNGDIPILRRP